MNTKNNPPVSEVLPKDVRDALVAASQIKNPFDRVRAVDKAGDHARLKYPRLFQQE